MNAVVYDLELVKRFRKGQLSEIIEIGACRVDLAARQITGQFQIYIMPSRGYIAKSTRTFINMSKEDMEKAVPFREAIRRFAEWIGDSDCYLCSWGSDDRIHVISECARKNVPLDWFRNYNDIQRQIGAILRPGVKEQLGLKHALELAGIEPVGKAHRGIDDALNTAQLLLRFADQLQFQRNTVSAHEIEQQRRRQREQTRRGASPALERRKGNGRPKSAATPRKENGQRTSAAAVTSVTSAGDTPQRDPKPLPQPPPTPNTKG